MTDSILNRTDLLARYAATGFPPPWLPEGVALFYQWDRDLWTSDDSDALSLDFEAMQSLALERLEPLMVLGQSGHGVASHFDYAFWIDAELLLLSRIPLNPLEADPNEPLEPMARRNRGFEEVFQLKERIVAAGRWPKGKRFLLRIDDTEPDESGCGWVVDGKIDLEDWLADEGPALYAAAILGNLLD